MTNAEKIKHTLLQHRNELSEKVKVKTIGIFGSYAKGEQKQGSDLDVLVEFEEPV
jgi:predicted nucleotidyltransferase